MQHLQSSLCTCFKRLPKFIFFYAASCSERQEIWTWKQIQFLPCFLGKQQALCYLRNVCLSNRASPKGDSELTLLPSPWGRLLWGGEKKRKQNKKHIKKIKKRKRKQTCMFWDQCYWRQALAYECYDSTWSAGPWPACHLNPGNRRAFLCSPFLTPP